MQRIVLIGLVAVLLAVSPARAQDLEYEQGPREERVGRQLSEDCGRSDWLEPVRERSKGVGVWRNPSTGDVLIRGNIHNGNRPDDEADGFVCPDLDKESKRRGRITRW